MNRFSGSWQNIESSNCGDVQAHSHQIRGHVYIVDKNHLYIRKFSYDGGGSLEAFFWVKLLRFKYGSINVKYFYFIKTKLALCFRDQLYVAKFQISCVVNM